jgi:hypothetical protein
MTCIKLQDEKKFRAEAISWQIIYGKLPLPQVCWRICNHPSVQSGNYTTRNWFSDTSNSDMTVGGENRKLRA